MGILVDSREKISHRERAQALRERLVSHGLRSEVIQLPVGDFLAVAIPKGGGSVEESSLLVLDTVVERKVLCDFKATIAAKRHYHSQKVRLSRCGLSRPFYLVEGHLDRWPHQQERQRMSMEFSRIEMSDGLLLHLSRNTDETIKFLKSAQQRLSRVLSSKTPREARSEGLLTTYAEFKERTSPRRRSRLRLVVCCSTYMACQPRWSPTYSRGTRRQGRSPRRSTRTGERVILGDCRRSSAAGCSRRISCRARSGASSPAM